MLWLASLASAAPPSATVGGLGSARGVALFLPSGDGSVAVPCRDDGAGGDPASDGRWTCAPLPPGGGTVPIGVAHDTRFTLAGEADPSAGLAIRLTESGATIASDPSALPAGPGAGAAPRTLILARVTGLGEGPAPVLRLQAQGGSSELVCRDDGIFPDRGRNDGQHGCLGPTPAGGSAEVYLNGVEGASSFGTVAWGADDVVAMVEVDAAGRTSRTVDGPLPAFTEVPVLEEAPPPPTEEPAPAPEGEPPPQPEAPGEAPALSKPLTPAPAVETTPLPTPPLWMVIGIGAALGAAWAMRSRPTRLPDTLRVHPSPPLLPNGPGIADSPVAFRSDDPPALAATLLPLLARHRRVVVVSRTWAAFAPVSEGIVYRSASDDCEEVEVAARALAASPGPPVAVLVVGDDALAEPGAVRPDPFRRLREGLPLGTWLGVVVNGEVPEGFAAWTAAGPPYTLQQA